MRNDRRVGVWETTGEWECERRQESGSVSVWGGSGTESFVAAGPAQLSLPRDFQLSASDRTHTALHCSGA